MILYQNSVVTASDMTLIMGLAISLVTFAFLFVDEKEFF